MSLSTSPIIYTLFLVWSPVIDPIPVVLTRRPAFHSPIHFLPCDTLASSDDSGGRPGGPCCTRHFAFNEDKRPEHTRSG
ncbi:hypothetical protein BCV70DRAFT_35561 [Testicularia cyperi]|uniref:Uncharacterized protein n=1 Tax=Testicularia cyperi TaxID=1882483 RepID=A0A317XJG1_9BASI|nr:hypothetical protein BCV70DRAFT_35561 [Testicularia cyperi]